MDRLRGILTFCAILGLLLNAVLAAGPAAAEPIELPQADRNALESLLGPGVVGAAVSGKPLPASSRFMPVQDATWTFRFASGEQQGATEQAVLTPLPQDTAGKSGRFAIGGETILYFRESDGGDLYIVTEHNLREGRITRFAPSEPVILSGMTPGSSKRTQADVKLYDVSDPNEVTHQGMVDLTYSYIGAYKVTVPAGAFDAVLIKWHYNGEVGPASVEDTQYRFFAEGVGPIATVDKSDISAFLVYQDHSKAGKVLVEKN
jgi:hypothetical protein